jgi:hypothetical protein
MDEKLIELTTQETINIEPEGIINIAVNAEDLEQKVEIEETVDVVEAEDAEEIVVEMEEAVGWVGGDSTRHYSLYGREENDQHPIGAISGLREELDSLEALQTVYSNKKSSADYYAWHDNNLEAENRVGYFVSMCDDIRTIRKCAGRDVFGVVVDSAAFIGGQDDVSRDYKYGLVAHSGIVQVRCELDVNVGNYVISNAYGVAQKTDDNCGYKVITTTLASSRWKSLEQINEAGLYAVSHYPDVIWWDQNWRKGGLSERRIAIIKEYDFYNQQYCGCEFSMRNV